MRDTIDAGAVLIRDGALLPKELQIESEPCVPGWRLVKDFDGYGLDRAVQKTGWTFFCLAGEIGVIVLGMDVHSMVRRAIKRIAARLESKQFNSLEITRVARKRFLGLPCLSIGAQSRHMQHGLFLFSAERNQEPEKTKLITPRAKEWGLTSAKGPAPEETNGRASVAATPRP